MKYEFTGVVRTTFGRTLKQIKALVTIPGVVSAGECGGWIEHEHNLDNGPGAAWVHADARVYGNARVLGNAQVYADARVYGNAHVYADARVYGNVYVYGNAHVYGAAWVHGNAYVYGNAYVSTTPTTISGMYYPITVSDNMLAAGCQCWTFSAWRAKTPAQIQEMDGDAATRFYPTLLAILDLLGK